MRIRHPWESIPVFWGKRCAAAVAALSMVGAATECRDDDQSDAPATATTVVTPPAATERPETTGTITSPSRPVTTVPLEGGRLVNGMGVSIDSGHSWPVDCINENGNTSTRSNHVNLAANFVLRTSIVGVQKDTAFFGERVKETLTGDNALSHGWAVRAVKNGYEFYEFTARPRAGTLFSADAIGVLVAERTAAQLAENPVVLQDESMIFQASYLDNEAAKPLEMTITCKD